MAKITFTITDTPNGEDVDISADFDPSCNPSEGNNNTKAQIFALRVAEFIHEFGARNSRGVSAALYDDNDKLVDTFVTGDPSPGTVN